MPERVYLACERETIIRFDDETDRAVVNTFNRAFQRKMEKLLKDFPDDVFLINDYKSDEYNGIYVTIPKSWVRIRTPMKISDEKRKQMADAMRERMHKPESNVRSET